MATFKSLTTEITNLQVLMNTSKWEEDPVFRYEISDRLKDLSKALKKRNQRLGKSWDSFLKTA